MHAWVLVWLFANIDFHVCIKCMHCECIERRSVVCTLQGFVHIEAGPVPWYNSFFRRNESGMRRLCVCVHTRYLLPSVVCSACSDSPRLLRTRRPNPRRLPTRTPWTHLPRQRSPAAAVTPLSTPAATPRGSSSGFSWALPARSSPCLPSSHSAVGAVLRRVHAATAGRLAARHNAAGCGQRR